MKRSLHIGINYTGKSYELRGCVNDATQLTAKFKAMGYSTRTMTDTKGTRLEDLPTRQNIIKAISLIVESSGPNDTVFISYSGHGVLKRDVSGDEASGFDSSICPVDMDSSGVIIDDDLYTLVDKGCKGLKTVGLFDCCHSGTILDLRFNYDPINKHYIDDKVHKITKSDVILFSGCGDSQTSADAYIDGAFCGVLTWSFLRALCRSERRLSKMIQEINVEIKSRKYDQIPRLSCGNSSLTGTDILPL